MGSGDKECSPFVPGGEFTRRLMSALNLDGEQVTSIQLTFDMDDLCRLEIKKHADLGQIEEVVSVLEHFDVGERLVPPVPDLSDVMGEFRGFEIIDTDISREAFDTTCLDADSRTFKNGNDVILTVHLRGPSNA